MSRRLHPWLLTLVAVVVGIALVPEAAAVLLGLNFALLLGTSGMQMVASVLARASARARRVLPLPSPERPFVSIHVPICNEPPAIVKQTLDHLAAITYDRYEVIVLDNNTRDEAVWRPIEAHCRALGPRFRFIHVGELEGAKAGALELCRLSADPGTELVMVVDADYCVLPSILERALYYLTPGVSFVQFPQAYYNDTKRGTGLSDEYSHYFELFMPFADATGCTLLTGTLCVVRRDALERAGGWQSCTITEDAELGLRLNLSGFRGRYAPEVAGRGLMPTDLRALRKQRRRWVYGNAQTLRQLRWSDLRALGPWRALGVLLQLTAWFDFLLLPSLVLVAAAMLPMSDVRWATTILAAATVALQILLKLVAIAMAPRRIERRPRHVLRALMVHLGLAWEGATAWLEAMLGADLGFERTEKAARASSLRQAKRQLAASLVLVLASCSFALRGYPWLAAGALLTALALGSVLYLHRELRAVPRAVRASRPSRPSRPSIEATP